MKPESRIQIAAAIHLFAFVMIISPAAWALISGARVFGTSVLSSEAATFFDVGSQFFLVALVMGVPVLLAFIGLWKLKKWGLWFAYIALVVIAYNSILSLVGYFASLPSIYLELSLIGVGLYLALSVFSVVYVYRYRDYLI